MRMAKSFLICCLLATGLSAQQRPQVPCEPATVKLPGVLAIGAAGVTVSVSPLPAAASAKDGQLAPAMVSGDTKVALPASIAPNSVNEAGLSELVLKCEDDQALRALLTGMGITPRAAGEARALPEFLLAVGCDPAVGSDWRTVTEAQALANIDPPAGPDGQAVRVARYMAGSDGIVQYVADHPQQRFIVIVDIHNLTATALKTLSGGNIVAIVVGHYYAADAQPWQVADFAVETAQVTKAIRLASDAPVLLAVSPVVWYAKRQNATWAKSFDPADYDGWAIYNLHNWPAILEAGTTTAPATQPANNPLTMALGRMGLGDKPCLLLDFVGTPSDYPPARAAYMKAIWQAKAPLLLGALKAQGWRGAILYTTNLDDARMKSQALKSALGN